MSMKTLLTLVVFALTVPAVAQTTAPPASPMSQGPAPGTQTSPGQTDASSLGGALVHDLTGQPIFDSKDMRLGAVRAMSKDHDGGQAVLLAIEKVDGLSGQVVSLPMSSLRPRKGGGFTTSLSTAELKTHTAP
ncbi:PRC-barrel domain-containing protein [Rhizomicrobium palustre]